MKHAFRVAVFMAVWLLVACVIMQLTVLDFVAYNNFIKSPVYIQLCVKENATLNYHALAFLLTLIFGPIFIYCMIIASVITFGWPGYVCPKCNRHGGITKSRNGRHFCRRCGWVEEYWHGDSDNATT
jgi:hypothetical protein